MLWCAARSVREERSKQRCAMQEFSHIRVTLIKGKTGWKVGSTEALGNAFLQANQRTQRVLINFVITQLRRYVHGEIPLAQVYEDVCEIVTNSELYLEKAVSVQKVFLVRLLSELGYVAPDPVWSPIVTAPTLQMALLLYTSDMVTHVEKAITEGTQASHL